MTWTAVIALALGTYAMKAAGPVALGSRHLDERVQAAFSLIAITLLGALLAISTVASGRHLHPDARIAGVAVAAVAVWLRAPFVVIVIAAAATAAALRAIT